MLSVFMASHIASIKVRYSIFHCFVCETSRKKYAYSLPEWEIRWFRLQAARPTAAEPHDGDGLHSALIIRTHKGKESSNEWSEERGGCGVVVQE